MILRKYLINSVGLRHYLFHSVIMLQVYFPSGFAHLQDEPEMTMKVSEAALLKSGFTPAQLQSIKNNIEIYGGTIEEVIQDLANRFRVSLWVTSAGVCFFIYLLLFSSEPEIVGGGISILITIMIAVFMQPPVLAYRAWRHWRLYNKKIL